MDGGEGYHNKADLLKVTGKYLAEHKVEVQDG
jgi:hypothetical protein